MDPDFGALEKADRPVLLAIIAEQWELIKELRARVKALEEEIRRGHRSAAPFSKGVGKANPQKPGRKAGQGEFTRRLEPVARPEDQVEEISAPLARRECPHCCSALVVGSETATIEDLPVVAPRRLKRFCVEVGQCPKCGRKVRGTHPELPRDQHGATAHRLGAQVLSQALSLHYHFGMPLCKVPGVIAMSKGIEVTQSALTQAAGALCEAGAPVQRAYENLRQQVAQEPVVNTDDTGWRIGARAAQLMGFFTPQLAVYQIRDQHRHQEVREMIGSDFEGALGTDRGKSYDAEELSAVAQQKCLRHLVVNLREVEERKVGRAKVFSSQLKKTLQESMVLWKNWRDGQTSQEEFDRCGGQLRQRVDDHLRPRNLKDVDNQRLLEGIGWQHHQGRVLLFLDFPQIEPTNNRAERGLRSAVIARKVSHCSKNQRGAAIYEAMKSVLTTLYLRGQNVSAQLARLIEGQPIMSSG